MEKPYDETEISGRDWHQMFSFHRELYANTSEKFFNGRVLEYLRFLLNASEVEYVENNHNLSATVRYKRNELSD